MNETVRRNKHRWIVTAAIFAAVASSIPVQGAEPITITFEDINNKPFGHDLLPPFPSHGVVFSGGGLHRTDAAGTWYSGRNRNPVQMQFPPGSTDISFNVAGRGQATFPQPPNRDLAVQVWNGDDGTGILVETLPIPSASSSIVPPTGKVTIPGPLSRVTIFTEPKPPGAFDYWYVVNIDNVRYSPPDSEASIAFDAVLPAHTKVLTHNYGDHPYPSQLQTQDGAIRVQATVRIAGQPAAGKTVHFRLIDPPDPSAYVKQAGDDHFGDNFDGPGSLDGAGTTTATGVSDGAGRVSVTLHVTSFASGDNYQIEASSKESFSCGSSCPKSAVYTAWKRVYVEYNKMFRRGAFLTQDVPAGAKEIPVDDVRSFPTPPFEIRMLHAAKVAAPTADFATNERVTIVKISKAQSGLLSFFMPGPEPGLLYLDPSPDVAGLLQAYSGAEKIYPQDRSYLADGVGLVTGTRAADFFLSNGTLVNGLFDQAYAEYVWLTDAMASDSDLSLLQPRIHYDGVLPLKTPVGGEGLDVHQQEWLTRKWVRHASRTGIGRTAQANHQILFTTGHFWRKPNNLLINYGLTHVGSGLGDSWMPVAEIGSQSLLAEAVPHELAHQWRVNHGGTNPKADKGHCGKVSGQTALFMSGAATKYCTMTDGIYDSPEATDGTVGFHYQKFGNAVDSEYLRIRRRADPVPLNEQNRNTPQ